MEYFCPCAQSGRTLYCFFSASRRIALQIRSLYKNQLHESIDAVHSNQDICLNLELGQSMPSYAPRRALGLNLADMDQEINSLIKFLRKALTSRRVTTYTISRYRTCSCWYCSRPQLYIYFIYLCYII